MRIEVKTVFTDYLRERLVGSKGTLRVTKKSGKYIAQIAVEAEAIEQEYDESKVMGVDLGLKVPAVAVVESGKTRFFGNGRRNKFVRRRHRSTRRKLGKQKNRKQSANATIKNNVG